MRSAIISVIVGLVLVAPASAQAPTLDDRVADLEQRVEALEAQVASGDPCIRSTLAVSARGNRDLFATRTDRQRRIHLAVIDKRCLAGAKDNYGWYSYLPPYRH